MSLKTSSYSHMTLQWQFSITTDDLTMYHFLDQWMSVCKRWPKLAMSKRFQQHWPGLGLKLSTHGCWGLFHVHVGKQPAFGAAKHGLLSYLECIFDSNFQSLCHRISWQLNTTSISDRVHSYKGSIREKRSPIVDISRSDSYALRWILHKVHPKLRCTLKTK